MSSFVSKYASQNMFDQLCEELITQEGQSIEEASQQTVEMFADEYDMSKLYVYRNKAQYELKKNIQRICTTLSNAAKGTDTFVNANFGLQGLAQVLPTDQQCYKLLESYKIITSLIKLISVDKENDDKNDEMIGEDEDDDDDDEDADRKFQTMRCLDTLQFISIEVIKNPQLVFSSNEFFNIGEENIDIILKRLDEDMGDEEIATKIIEFLLIILSFEGNRLIFKDKGGIDLLELTSKMNKKNQFISDAVEKIKTI
jgi:hypothetical protein